jgi:hypothetical protein
MISMVHARRVVRERAGRASPGCPAPEALAGGRVRFDWPPVFGGRPQSSRRSNLTTSARVMSMPAMLRPARLKAP